MLLNDHQIKELDLVSPFQSHLEGKNILSYGLSSFGYDVRISSKELLATEPSSNPKTINPKWFSRIEAEEVMTSLSLQEDKNGQYFLLPPYAHALGVTVEYIQVPRNVLTVTLNKSTYRRCGLEVPTTVLEPEWEGYLTLELKNQTPHYLQVFAGEGICQLVSMQGQDCQQSYNDRAGKYQNQQPAVTFPRIENYGQHQ
ncbi:MAG: dCTP deaminase [Candidatus Bipolaricaulia bacterium]